MKAFIRLVIVNVIFFMALPANSSSDLNGVASYQNLGKEIFLGALYSQDTQSPERIKNLDQSLKIEVRAVSKITKRRWVNLWMQSIAINNRKEVFEAEAEDLVSLFDTFQSGLKTGDVFVLDYSFDNDTTQVTLNGVELLSGLSKNFFGLFLNSWIGTVPPSTDYKSAILGLTNSDELASRLNSITPLDDRVAEITAWLAPEPEPVVEVEIETPEPVVVAEPEPEPEVPVEPEPVVEEIIEEELPEEEVIVSVESLIAQQEYTNRVVRKIYSSLKYPKRAIDRNMQGVVRVQLQVTRDGNIEETLLSESSEYGILNRAALKAVDKAAPFEPIPDVVIDDSMQFAIPIVFKITE